MCGVVGDKAHGVGLCWSWLCWAACCSDASVQGADPSDTFYGTGALANVTTGFEDSAFGYDALNQNTTGSRNTATGAVALYSNTTGNSQHGQRRCSALLFQHAPAATTRPPVLMRSIPTARAATTRPPGLVALLSNTTGSFNTATGDACALFSNTTGELQHSQRFSWRSLSTRPAATTRPVVPQRAPEQHQRVRQHGQRFRSAAREKLLGSLTRPAGYTKALGDNTTGTNTRPAVTQLCTLTPPGANNRPAAFALLWQHYWQLQHGQRDQCARSQHHRRQHRHGPNALLQQHAPGGSNIALGASAGFESDHGEQQHRHWQRWGGGESNTIRIGTKGTQTATYIAGISGATVAGGVGVMIDTNGHLGTVTSSARYKDSDQADGQGERSDPRAPTGDLPLQEGA